MSANKERVAPLFLRASGFAQMAASKTRGGGGALWCSMSHRPVRDGEGGGHGGHAPPQDPQPHQGHCVGLPRQQVHRQGGAQRLHREEGLSCDNTRLGTVKGQDDSACLGWEHERSE